MSSQLPSCSSPRLYPLSIIVEQAPPKTLINEPKHEYTKSLLSRLPRIWGKDIKGPEAVEAPALMSVEDAHRTYFVRKKGTFRGMNAVQAVKGKTSALSVSPVAANLH